MELIDRLEQRVDSLLRELAELKEENNRLSEARGDNSQLEEEIRKLREELDQERAIKNAVLARVDGLLKKLKAESDDS